MMLPYPSSLRHLTFTVNVSPGFLSEVLQALEQVPCEDKDCTLIFDAMSIWQQLCWSEVDHRYISYCNYGNNFNFEGNEIEAKEVLVFMVVSLKGKWKWPIAYFFKTGMLSATLAELIKTALILTSKAKLKVRSITCDIIIDVCGHDIFMSVYQIASNKKIYFLGTFIRLRIHYACATKSRFSSRYIYASRLLSKKKLKLINSSYIIGFIFFNFTCLIYHTYQILKERYLTARPTSFPRIF